MLVRLIEAGKGKTAAKLRALLCADFGMAMRAGLDPTLPRGDAGIRHSTQPGRPAFEPDTVLEPSTRQADFCPIASFEQVNDCIHICLVGARFPARLK